jgi:hypothetical protein
LREREVFLDGACFLKLRRDGGEWLINIYGSEFNLEGDWPPDDYFLYVNKYTTDGKPWHTISWNANYEAEAAYSRYSGTLEKISNLMERKTYPVLLFPTIW